jgi:ferredoxin
MKFEILIDECIGAGQCVVAASEFFAQNEDDGLVVVLKEDVGEAEEDIVRLAARRCPARAIIIHE